MKQILETNQGFLQTLRLNSCDKSLRFLAVRYCHEKLILNNPGVPDTSLRLTIVPFLNFLELIF